MEHVLDQRPRERCGEHSSEQKLRNFRPPYLTKNIIIREYLNLGKLSQFLLNHFDSET
jgi:hypothetical protein